MIDNAITHALDQVARQLGEARSANEVLDSITVAVRESIDEIDHVGISITHRNGRIETRSRTDDLVLQLDQLQYDLREGPCLDAMSSEHDEDVIRVDHLQDDQRWPRYRPQAVAAGVRSQMGLRLFREDTTVGGLNLYSTTSDEITDQGEALARLFATHAVLALGRVNVEQSLNTALETRTLIGQATGIVMERYDLSADRAFDYLVRVSQSSNIKIRDVAAEMVHGHAGRVESG